MHQTIDYIQIYKIRGQKLHTVIGTPDNVRLLLKKQETYVGHNHCL